MAVATLHNFDVDHAWSCAKRDAYLKHFYQKYSLDGRYVFIDKTACSTLIQKRLEVDTIMQSMKTGASFCIEEKIERWPMNGRPRTNFALETDSCTLPGKEQPGWMRYAKADYLLYAFETEQGNLDTYFIDFPQLRSWFWRVQSRYQSYTMDTSNRTRFKKVPIRDVVQSIRTTRYLVTSNGCQFVSRQGVA